MSPLPPFLLFLQLFLSVLPPVTAEPTATVVGVVVPVSGLRLQSTRVAPGPQRTLVFLLFPFLPVALER